MAMSKKIIEDHGGEIKVASEAGEGTAIVIELPLENAG
jgi:signal transduction histidine kinase